VTPALIALALGLAALIAPALFLLALFWLSIRALRGWMRRMLWR
jgi:hypothetical protein